MITEYSSSLINPIYPVMIPDIETHSNQY